MPLKNNSTLVHVATQMRVISSKHYDVMVDIDDAYQARNEGIVASANYVSLSKYRSAISSHQSSLSRKIIASLVEASVPQQGEIHCKYLALLSFMTIKPRVSAYI